MSNFFASLSHPLNYLILSGFEVTFCDLKPAEYQSNNKGRNLRLLTY